MKKEEIHLGKMIKEVAIQRDMQLIELAEKLGITKQTLNSWLNKDDISVKKLFTISQILNYDFFKHFRLNSINNSTEKPRITIQIDIDPENNNDVLQYIRDKELYELLKSK